MTSAEDLAEAALVCLRQRRACWLQEAAPGSPRQAVSVLAAAQPSPADSCCQTQLAGLLQLGPVCRETGVGMPGWAGWALPVLDPAVEAVAAAGCQVQLQLEQQAAQDGCCASAAVGGSLPDQLPHLAAGCKARGAQLQAGWGQIEAAWEGWAEQLQASAGWPWGLVGCLWTAAEAAAGCWGGHCLRLREGWLQAQQVSQWCL